MSNKSKYILTASLMSVERLGMVPVEMNGKSLENQFFF